MKLAISPSVEALIVGTKYWFRQPGSMAGLVRKVVPGTAEGVYCLWWKDVERFPLRADVELKGGARGRIQFKLERWKSELAEAIALYVGKGSIRTRLSSHIKAPRPGRDGRKIRNPYAWLATIFPGRAVGELIQENIGFSFVEVQDKLEQVYAENLAIGLLKPWFNIRLTS